MREFSTSFVEQQSLLLKFWFDASEMAGFDQLQVWRSTMGEGGPYAEMTAPTLTPAVLVGELVQGNVVGKTLEFLVNTQAYSVTFEGTAPISLASIASQINVAGTGAVYAEPTEDARGMYLETVGVGAGMRLEVTGGDAAPLLGFSTLSPTNCAYGLDARPALVEGTNAYTFMDVWHKATYFYKTRLRSSTTNVVSGFSMPIGANATCAVLPSRLIRGWVLLVDIQGRPVADRTILISTQDTVHNLVVDGLLVDTADQAFVTDAQGYGSVLLLRGLIVSIAVAGTSLVRSITAPVDPALDSFNLFDLTLSSDDAFAVQVPNIDIAARMPAP